jgi:hypothetical protein
MANALHELPVLGGGREVMVGSNRLKLRLDDRLLDAEFSVDITGPRSFVVILESSGGATGGRRPRNSEYPEALAELLRRSSAIADSLDECLILSRATRHLPEEERVIPPAQPYSYPIALDHSVDFERLRLALTSPQGHIASKADSRGGNERKRIGLRFSARTHGLTESDVTKALNAAPSDNTRRDRKDIALGLTKSDVDTARAEWLRLGPELFHSTYGTSRAAKFVIADPDGTEYDAKAILFAARSLAGLDGTNADFDGDQRTVQEPLRRLGFLVEDISKGFAADFDNDDESNDSQDRAIRQARAFVGNLDAVVERRVRREQRLLRRALGLGGGSHQCSICGRTFPDRLLVAAHIKPRSACERHEKIDVPAIAMIACSLGCDALFEFGFIAVNDLGIVDRTERADSGNHVQEMVSALEGRSLIDYNPASAAYFAWHRENVGRPVDANARR